MRNFLCVLFLALSLVSVAYAEGTPTDLEPGTQPDGTVITEAEDGTILIDTSSLDGAASGDGDFLSKSFNSYSVTEGFLLLYLILFFCVLCWCVIRRCIYG